MDLIITCLMPKSLCLGWSCETGPSCNITTVMVFQNGTQVVTLQHLLCQAYMLYSLYRNIYKCTMDLCFPSYFPRFITFFHLFCFSFLVSVCSVFVRWGCYACRCTDRRQDHQGIVFICSHSFKLPRSLFCSLGPVHRL